MLKRILVGVTGSSALEAKMALALDLAGRHGAELSLLSVVDAGRLAATGPVPIGAGSFAERLRHTRIERSHEAARAALARFHEAAAAAGLAAQVLDVEGDPCEVIKDVGRFHDLLVLGTHGWFDDTIVPEPDHALLDLVANGTLPILAVPEMARPIRRALVAYDGSVEASKALKRFLELGPWPDVELTLVCAGETDSGEPPRPLLEAAADYVRKFGHQVSVATLAANEPVPALLAAATAHEADLIVMGASYRRILLAQRFGRNTLAMVKQSSLPLFISH